MGQSMITNNSMLQNKHKKRSIFSENHSITKPAAEEVSKAHDETFAFSTSKNLIIPPQHEDPSFSLE